MAPSQHSPPTSEFCENEAYHREIYGSHSGDTVGGSCRAIDGFDEGDAAPPFKAIASGGAVLLDGLEEIFENGLMAAKVGDGSGRCAIVFVERGGFGGSASVAKIGGDDAVVLEDDGAFGA